MVYTEFDRLGTGSDANCKKGMPCGNSCISKLKKCRKGLGADVAAVVDHVTDSPNLEQGAGSSEVTQGGKEQSLIEKFPKISGENPDAYRKESQIGDNKVHTFISDDFFLSLEPPPSVQAIGIRVNDGYDKSSSIEGKDGLKLALASREHVREYVKAAPEGTVLSNSPYQADGFGDQRVRLYEKAGFSPPNSDNEMYSIVSGGKNIPITLDEIKLLKDAGHFTK